jgi:CheY-like chemotaxis protein
MERHSGSGELGTRYKVGICDDQLDMRELLALRFTMVQALEVVGHAGNGVEAIDLARTLCPDLMILDLNMPVMGGTEAIPLLRAAAPHMRIVVFSSDPTLSDLKHGPQPDALVSKGTSLADLVAIVLGLLAEGPSDVVQVDLGRLPFRVAVEAFDSWVGLNARVRAAMATKGDDSVELLGDIRLDPSDLLCLMGVFLQIGIPLRSTTRRGAADVELKFEVRRDVGVGARRALLALGGNGTLRAFNRAWSHTPTREAQEALDIVDSRLVEQLPTA